MEWWSDGVVDLWIDGFVGLMDLVDWWIWWIGGLMEFME